jgi:hypothetical protein
MKMNIHLERLIVRTRRTTEIVTFAGSVTFLHGPVSTGKSTTARLVDYCFGGDLERTPAVQQEFITAELAVTLGQHRCILERGADENQSIRVTWDGDDGAAESVSAPLAAQDQPFLEPEVHNFSDLVFHLCGVVPIKVRKRSLDPGSPLVRLSIRDLWWYCNLDQTHLDSSFFRLEDPFRGRKSQDAMRFFTGLHSERLSQLEAEVDKTANEQRAKHDAVRQIRQFMARFNLASDLDLSMQLDKATRELAEANIRRAELEATRSAKTHPADVLRSELRQLGLAIANTRQAITDSEESIQEQRALRAELITAKIKAERATQASKILEGVQYARCPQCGTDISNRSASEDHCKLCGSPENPGQLQDSADLEALRRDFNDRIDQIADSIQRRERELERTRRGLVRQEELKGDGDNELQRQLARYDSAFVESIRGIDRAVATLTERIRSLRQLQLMPEAITSLENEAARMQADIDRLREALDTERARLRSADDNIEAIAAEFKRIMLAVSFPGVSEEDRVVIDPRNWKPVILHGDQVWSFWDTGSGGKKTLFNVCYALALHHTAIERDLPVPSLLIIDSPTKNISEDENPELVRLLYNEIYRLARTPSEPQLQFLLIDSDLVAPSFQLPGGFSERRMAGEENAPRLISYYTGP